MAPRRSTRLQSKTVNITINENSSGPTSSGKRKTKANRPRPSRPAKKSKKSTQATNVPDIINIVDIPPPTIVQPSRNGRPPVINLDVTYSESSDSDVSDVLEISTPQPTRKDVGKNGRCSLSDSDEDFVPDFCPKENQNGANSNINGSFTYDSDSDIESDIYKVNLEDEKEKAFEEMTKEFKKMNEEQKKKKRRKCSLDSLDNSNFNDSSEIWDEDKSCEDSSLGLSLEDSINNADLSSISVSNNNHGRGSIIGMSRKAKMALKNLLAFSKKFEDMEKVKNADESLMEDLDDIMIMEDREVSIRIFWGVDYTRHTVKKNNKLASLYQELAEKNNVSVNEVLLSFKDNILSPETKPSDINLSIGDILDGAIRRNIQKSSDDSESTKEGSLSFKVQTSNRKEVQTISINKYDKMSILMEKYSKLRNIPLNKLRFNFDGESLESSDTPATLDLEGGECIDVFEL